jgi:hypothetical protein
MLRKAIVCSFDAVSRTALVEYWGDAEHRAESVGVAAHVDADMLAAGSLVEVWAPAEARPDEALIVASRAAPASPDQTIADAHRRLDNLLGPASLATPWFNRIAVPANPDAHDAEFDANPLGAHGWAWAAEPGSATSSGWSLAACPHWLYVWQSTTANPNPAELRCTGAGNLPRFKTAMFFFYPATSAKLALRSVKDASNYTEFEISGAGIKGYKCIGGARTQVRPISSELARSHVFKSEKPAEVVDTWRALRYAVSAWVIHHLGHAPGRCDVAGAFLCSL